MFINRKSEGDVMENTNFKTKTIANEEQYHKSDEGAVLDEAVIHCDERCNIDDTVQSLGKNILSPSQLEQESSLWRTIVMDMIIKIQDHTLLMEK